MNEIVKGLRKLAAPKKPKELDVNELFRKEHKRTAICNVCHDTIKDTDEKVRISYGVYEHKNCHGRCPGCGNFLHDCECDQPY